MDRGAMVNPDTRAVDVVSEREYLTSHHEHTRATTFFLSLSLCLARLACLARPEFRFPHVFPHSKSNLISNPGRR